MKYTLNGSTVLLNKDIITEESLNTMIKEIDSSYESCSKAIEAYNLVSNVKAMESFGYKATEGLGESITNGAKAVWEKIKEFFKRISLFVNKMLTDFIIKIETREFDKLKDMLLKSSKLTYEAANKILKELNSKELDSSLIKIYQELEKNIGASTKITRYCAVALNELSFCYKHYENCTPENKSKIDKFVSELGGSIQWLEKACEEINNKCEDEDYLNTAGHITNYLDKSNIDIVRNIIDGSKSIRKEIIDNKRSQN